MWVYWLEPEYYRIVFSSNDGGDSSDTTAEPPES